MSRAEFQKACEDFANNSQQYLVKCFVCDVPIGVSTQLVKKDSKVFCLNCNILKGFVVSLIEKKICGAEEGAAYNLRTQALREDAKFSKAVDGVRDLGQRLRKQKQLNLKDMTE